MSSRRRGRIEEDEDDDAEEGAGRSMILEEAFEEAATSGRGRRAVRRKSGGDDDDDDDSEREALEDGVDRVNRALERRRGKHTFVYEGGDDDVLRKLAFVEGVTEKEETAWTKLNSEARNLCIKAVVRLFVFKGARGLPVTRANVNEAMAKIAEGDANSYSKHYNLVMNKVMQELETFGFMLTSGINVPGSEDKKDWYIVNRLRSAKLQEVLSELSPHDAYIGFVWVVSQIIYTSPGRKLDIDSILRAVRKVDRRFPDSDRGEAGGGRGSKASSSSSSSSSNGGGAAVPDLKDSFSGLIARMKKEGYINEVRPTATGTQVLETQIKVFELGPRVYAEFGMSRLAKTYYAGMGEEVDAGVLAEAKKMERGFVDAAGEGAGEGDGDEAGGEEGAAKAGAGAGAVAGGGGATAGGGGARGKRGGR